MREISVHPEAEEEIKVAAIYYDSLQPGLGAVFLQELAAGFAQVQEHPHAWGLLADGIRRYLLRRFPYGIVYRVTTDQIFVLAVMHLHRRPRYWQERDWIQQAQPNSKLEE